LRVLLTGWSDIDAVVQAVNGGRIDAYVAKPWTADRVRSLVRGAAERRRLSEDKTRLLGELAEAVGQPGVDTGRASSAEAALRTENAALQGAVSRVGAALRSLHEIEKILPICLECGRVQTGSAQWEDVLAVVRRIPAFLSHGYCPDCAPRIRAGWKAELAARKETK
jgi:hypothetical protein